MNSFDFMLLLKDFAGLFVAALLVYFAGRLLPKRARWFFWTAGFAIIIYELYLRINNRKILQELDEEWQRLKARKNALENNNQALREEAQMLAAKLAELESKAADTFAELDALKSKSTAQQEANKARIEELEKGIEDLRERRETLNELERKFNLNSTLIREIESVAPPAEA